MKRRNRMIAAVVLAMVSSGLVLGLTAFVAYVTLFIGSLGAVGCQGCQNLGGVWMAFKGIWAVGSVMTARQQLKK